jgi:multidrug efflux pump
MSISGPFIRRPIGTSLLTAALLLSGILAFNFLPVASLPKMDFPVISVGASLPGADPQTMASAVATPLERQFGRIAAVNQMTSSSQLGSTGIETSKLRSMRLAANFPRTCRAIPGIAR